MYGYADYVLYIHQSIHIKSPLHFKQLIINDAQLWNFNASKDN